MPNPPVPRSRNVRLLDVLPVVPYTALVFYTGLIRLGDLPEVGFVPTDKLLHALVFGGLALILLRAEGALLPHWPIAKRFAGALLGSSILGALLEVCQSFTTYRSADVLDWVADTVGSLLALAAAAVVLRVSARLGREEASGS